MTSLPPLDRDHLERGLYTRFSDVVATCPQSAALVDDRGVMTYQDLDRLARRYAAVIAHKVPRGEPVALFLAPGRDVVAAMLGALATGRPYLPLDPGFPLAPLRRAIDHCGARLVIGRTEDALAGLSAGTYGLSAVALPVLADPPLIGGANDPAYILLTSGSTGAPKCVWQDQRGLMHDVLQYSQAISITPADRSSLLYSPSVNGALRDIYGALLNGASLSMADLRGEGLAKVLSDLSRRQVTILHAMPPVLRGLMRSAGSRIAPFARVVYTAGDRFLAQDLADLRRSLSPGCRIYTGIGSTECATLYRHWSIPENWLPDTPLVPVGHAIADRDMRLIGDDGAEVAPGKVGQIEVTSAFMARGYWNDPELTAQAFPSCTDHPDQRRFRPGDLGRLRPDGLLDFCGRADRQIKVRGYRFDPVDIEAALRRLPGVAEAALVVETDGERVRTFGFVEATERQPLAEDQLRAAMAANLPPHLVPDRVLVLGKLPRLGNFKVDNARLHALAAEQAPSSGEVGLPPSYLAIWDDALKTQVDPRETLARLGADSLTLLEIELQVARQFRLSLRGLFSAETTPERLWREARPIAPAPQEEQSRRQDLLEKLSALMAQATGETIDSDGLVKIYNGRGNRPWLIWCFNYYGEADALARELGPDQPLLAFRSLNGILPPGNVDPAIERFVAETCLRSLEAYGLPPLVVVGGNCQAGRISQHLANCLWQGGIAVGSLIFMEKVQPYPYAGRILALFGKDSRRHNPVFHFRRPTQAWSRYTPAIESREIPGAHGEFFSGNQIAHLAAEIGKEIDRVTTDPAPLVPAALRTVELAVNLLPGNRAIHVRIGNPGRVRWGPGKVTGLAVTLHLVDPETCERPLRLPDQSVWLPHAIEPGGTLELKMEMPPGTRPGQRALIGFCEEGYGWFAPAAQSRTWADLPESGNAIS
ncbi:AMP-binding protein [Tabrizicola soli]|uniref:AMP-binding protein n=1 Tax=Tabrizicola soli TaxID=2185115 RepID=A0ABV7DWL5_9RHOB|nr:AMP-binding protein [Tabrizicola soli]